LKKRRSQLDLIQNFLQNANEARKTALMHSVNTSFKIFSEYLNYLIEGEFIEEVKKDNFKIYCLTEKGGDLLEHVNEVIEKLK